MIGLNCSLAVNINLRRSAMRRLFLFFAWWRTQFLWGITQLWDQLIIYGKQNCIFVLHFSFYFVWMSEPAAVCRLWCSKKEKFMTSKHFHFCHEPSYLPKPFWFSFCVSQTLSILPSPLSLSLQTIFNYFIFGPQPWSGCPTTFLCEF